MTLWRPPANIHRPTEPKLGKNGANRGHFSSTCPGQARTRQPRSKCNRRRRGPSGRVTVASWLAHA